MSICQKHQATGKFILVSYIRLPRPQRSTVVPPFAQIGLWVSLGISSPLDVLVPKRQDLPWRTLIEVQSCKSATVDICSTSSPCGKLSCAWLKLNSCPSQSREGEKKKTFCSFTEEVVPLNRYMWSITAARAIVFKLAVLCKLAKFVTITHWSKVLSPEEPWLALSYSAHPNTSVHISHETKSPKLFSPIRQSISDFISSQMFSSSSISSRHVFLCPVWRPFNSYWVSELCWWNAWQVWTAFWSEPCFYSSPYVSPETQRHDSRHRNAP